jgi:hypothetical protein
MQHEDLKKKGSAWLQERDRLTQARSKLAAEDGLLISLKGEAINPELLTESLRTEVLRQLHESQSKRTAK